MMLWKCCTQYASKFGKLSSGHRTGKGQFSLKERQCQRMFKHHIIALISWHPHSSTLAWKIPWMEEPGRLQSMGLLRVGHDWATSLSLFTFMHWRKKWQPTPLFLPGESQGEPGGLPSMVLHRVGHDWSDSAADSKCIDHFLCLLFWFVLWIANIS